MATHSKDARAFVTLLREKQLRIALAESITGGLAAHQVATARGASEVLAGSIVCYSPEVKKTLLGVSQAMIDRCTCESAEVTAALARGLEKQIDADIYVAVTGLAAKGGSETKTKPVGTVFICMRWKGRTHEMTALFRGTPLEIRKKTCGKLFGWVGEMLTKSSP